MPSQRTHGSAHGDIWVDHPRGRIFARAWSPEEPHAGADAPPIILFHDSLGCVELWRSFPAALCVGTGRRVIAYDRLGFGRSDPRDDRPAPLDFIADESRTYFPTVRQQLGFDRFIAFGHSVGGGMAVHCAAEFANACEALITESAQAFPEDRTLQGISAAREQFRTAGRLERLVKYHGEKARWVLEAWTECWLHPEFAAWTLEPVLPRVRCPLLAIHGTHDEYGTTRHPRMIADLSSGPSRIEIMPDTHHVPHREKERVVVELVVDFIASIK